MPFLAALLLALLLTGCGKQPDCIIAGKGDTITIGPRAPATEMTGEKPTTQVECKRGAPA